MNEIVLTKEEYEKRKEKLAYLKGARTLEIAEALKLARSFGDLSENAEYDAAKNEQANNMIAIATLEEELEHVKIVDEAMLSSGCVNVGTTVTFVNKTSGRESTFRVVGSGESDPRNGSISSESAIGAALIGHKKGETVEVHTPGGIVNLEIINVTR